MAIVICDISAFEYWSTPPLLGEAQIPSEQATLPQPQGAGLSPRQVNLRHDARPCDKLIHNRLLSDLKGIETPVHVYIDQTEGMRPTRLTSPRKLPENFPKELLADIGNGLSVLTIEAALCLMGTGIGVVRLAEMMFEACGLYALHRSNPRSDLVTKGLVGEKLLTPESAPSSSIYGYSDACGHKLGHLDSEGNEAEWTPVFDDDGRLSNMWKRPPLTTVENISETLAVLEPIRKCSMAREAVGLVMNGSASPAETKAAILLYSSIWKGGEGWKRPDLNRRIYYSSKSAQLAGTSFCIADNLWAEDKKVLEIQSVAHHGGKRGYRADPGRTAALECMGYVVAELSWDQLADLEKLDYVVPSLAEKLGFRLQERTVSFIKRRKKLHDQLFQ